MHHILLSLSDSQNLYWNFWQQNRSFPSARPPQQNAGFRDPNQVPNMYRISNEHQSSSQPVNFRIPRSTNQYPGVIESSLQSSTSLLRPQGHAGVSQDRSVHRTGVVSSQQSHLIATANRAAQMSVGSTRSVPSYPWNPDGHNSPTPMGDQRGISGATPSSQPVTRTDAHGSVDTNWRPAARMRGALVGQAYDEALNRNITQPYQRIQAARRVSNTTPLPNNGLPNLPASIPSGTVLGTPLPSLVSGDPVVRPAGSDILPNSSSGML